MKKLIIMLLAIMCLFIGCSKNETDEEIQLDPGSIILNDYYKGITYDNGYFYLLNDTEVYKYNLSTDVYSKLFDVCAEAVDTFKNEIFIFSSNGVTVYDEKGNVLQTFPYDMAEMEIYALDRCVGDDTHIVVSGWRSNSEFLEHKLFLIRRTDGTVQDITSVLKGNAELFQIQGVDISQTGKLLVTAKITSELDNSKNVCIEYNIEKQTVELRKNLPDAVQAQYTGDDIYFYSNQLVKCYDPVDDSITIVRKYSNELLSEKVGIEWSKIQFIFFVAGNNILMISPHAHAVYVDSLRYDSKPLRILCPDNIAMFYAIEETIADYESENHMNVEIVELPMEAYQDKLLLRFLSFDSEFDLYYLPGINASMTLYTILQNKQYYPLNNDPGIQKIFEKYNGGVAEVMKDGDNIYGLPWILNTYYLEVNESAFSEYDLALPNSDWTLDDVWSLCEIIETENLPVTVFSTDMDIISYMLTLWLEEDCTDEEALITLIERIQKNQNSLAPKDAGVYGDADNSLFHISWQYSSENYEESANKLVAFPKYTEDSARRLTLNAAVLMNPNTTQNEKAHEFLCRMYSDNCNVMDSMTIDFSGICKPYLLGGDAVQVINQTIMKLYDQSAALIANNMIKKIKRIVIE